jgi:3-hydroxyisobutyrate dehydrogenase-like beta-hydroxyacid dehydrogenase
MKQSQRLGLVGFGEVGRTLARDLIALGYTDLVTYDIACATADSGPSRAAKALGVTASAQPEILAGRDLLICAVTAAQTLVAAETVARQLDAGARYLDCNSAAPATKQQAAVIIDRAGGRYVEAAVMTVIGPKGLQTPILLGGPHARSFLADYVQLGLDAKVYAETVGQASSVKMCRSVIIKGIEAIMMECLLSARHYGVERDVLASLNDMFPGQDWTTLSGHMIRRSLQHGRRRAEEMREVAKTVADAGVTPHMTAGAVERHAWAAGVGGRVDGYALTGLSPLLDAVRADLAQTSQQAAGGESSDKSRRSKTLPTLG